MRRFSTALRAIHARKKLLVLDACHAGAAATSEMLAASRGGEEVDAVQRLARAEGIAILSASTARAYAYEVPELGHGVFSYALVRGLQGEAAYREDKHVSVYELLRYVDRQVPLLSRRYVGVFQMPIYSTQGQDFPLVALDAADPLLVGASGGPPAARRAETNPLSTNAAQAIRAHLEARKAAALSCVGSDALAIRATVAPGGNVVFAPRESALAPEDAECVRVTLGSLRVQASAGAVLVHALTRNP